MRLLEKFGPGLLVTAAFVGPGTVTTAGKAGAQFGFALVWALLFSLFATLVLQEMAARLGLATRMGLAQAMRQSLGNGWFGKLAMILVISAIGFGNAAYEAGNIAGAAMAIEQAVNSPAHVNVIIIGVITAALLALGGYGHLEKVLIALVLAMSALFILTAILVAPAVFPLFSEAFSNPIPSGSTWLAIALIGTTVVPYNLFLHANTVQEKWDDKTPAHTAIAQARVDTAASIGLGGLVTLAILSSAAAVFFQAGITYSHESMGLQLTPLLGDWAKPVFALGLFASGLTSAITAPLAAAYAVTGALNWESNLNARGFRVVWASVLAIGVVFALVGSSPLPAIIFAQAANGLLLPFVAVFLLMVMNNRQMLGEHINRLPANLAGGFVLLVTFGLGLSKLWSLLF